MTALGGRVVVVSLRGSWRIAGAEWLRGSVTFMVMRRAMEGFMAWRETFGGWKGPRVEGEWLGW